MSLSKAHKELDKALNAAHKDGYGYGFIEGAMTERERIIEIIRATAARGIQYRLDTENETYTEEEMVSTEALVNLIESDNN